MWIKGSGAALVALLVLTGGVSEARKKGSSDRATAENRYEGLQAALERYEPDGRADWQKPGRVLLLLAVAEGETVADLGTGTGFMIPTLSGAVGEVGKVYAVDLERELVDYAASRSDSPYDNVVPVVAAPDDPKLPEGELDLILIVNTWHHIDKRRDYLRKLIAALAPGGRIAVIDWLDQPTEIGPPVDHRLGRRRVVEEFSRELQLVGESVVLPYQYFLLFMRAEDAKPVPIER